MRALLQCLGLLGALTAAGWLAAFQAPTGDPFTPRGSLADVEGWLQPFEVNSFLRQSAIEADVFDLTMAGDCRRGWAVGTEGTIIATSDGGGSWRRVPVSSNVPLYSLAFLNEARRGWLVGGAGELMAMSFEERAANPCIGAERADLVLAGCAILDAIRRAFPCQRLRVADRGLREGMLVEMMREDGVWGEA